MSRCDAHTGMCNSELTWPRHAKARTVPYRECTRGCVPQSKKSYLRDRQMGIPLWDEAKAARHRSSSSSCTRWCSCINVACLKLPDIYIAVAAAQDELHHDGPPSSFAVARVCPAAVVAASGVGRPSSAKEGSQLRSCSSLVQSWTLNAFHLTGLQNRNSEATELESSNFGRKQGSLHDSLSFLPSLSCASSAFVLARSDYRPWCYCSTAPVGG
eukprot:533633-Pelagomonas_calceolata.AAC.4